jgi:Family of unknown function (DUF5681)
MPFKKGETPKGAKPFIKGKTGNPNGRPKKLPVLDDLIAEVMGDENNGITAAMAILMKMRHQAIAGNLKASELLLDRAYGKAKQELKIDPESVIRVKISDE